MIILKEVLNVTQRSQEHVNERKREIVKKYKKKSSRNQERSEALQNSPHCSVDL